MFFLCSLNGTDVHNLLLCCVAEALVRQREKADNDQGNSDNCSPVHGSSAFASRILCRLLWPVKRTRERSHQAQRKRWLNSDTRKRTRKMKKIIFAIPAAASAIPPKPSTAAISATIKNPNAQRSITTSSCLPFRFFGPEPGDLVSSGVPQSRRDPFLL